MPILRVNQDATAVWIFTVTDVDGAPVDRDQLTSVTLTLYDAETYDRTASPIEGIINSRLAQDVLVGGSPLGGDGVTYLSDGQVRWDLESADNPILDHRRQIERHVAVFDCQWTGGRFLYELHVDVLNLGIAA